MTELIVMLRTVYKCVGHGFSETLYSQLLEHVRVHLRCVVETLKVGVFSECANNDYLYLFD